MNTQLEKKVLEIDAAYISRSLQRLERLTADAEKFLMEAQEMFAWIRKRRITLSNINASPTSEPSSTQKDLDTSPKS